MSGKEVVKILLSNGWSLARKKGAHYIFKHPQRPDQIVVPMGRPLKPGLTKWIMVLARSGANRVVCNA